MARSRPDDNSAHRQLSLDDWAEEVKAAQPAPKAPPREATSHGRGETAVVPTAQHYPAAIALLTMPDALLTRTHLRELGLERRAVDAVFRALPVVALPGYSRPMVRAHDYVELVEQNTFHDDRVRPMARAS
jgi:hypothetical protein